MPGGGGMPIIPGGGGGIIPGSDRIPGGGAPIMPGGGGPPIIRGLHSSTFQLNVSASCGIGVAFRGCLGGVWGVYRVYTGVLGGIKGCSRCIWCQNQLRLSWEMDECKPLPIIPGGMPIMPGGPIPIGGAPIPGGPIIPPMPGGGAPIIGGGIMPAARAVLRYCDTVSISSPCP